MPAACLANMTRGALYTCFPEEITVRPDLNGRHDKPDIEALIVDILKHGQIQPVQVWDDGGKPTLISGYSRWRAISEINKRKLTPKKLVIECKYVKTNETGAFTRNISENRMRNSVTPIDDAHNISKLFEVFQYTETEAAQLYFPNAKTDGELKEALKFIRSRVALIGLTKESEQAVIDGRLNETAAIAIAKLSGAQQREALKSKEGTITAKELRKAPVKRKPKLPVVDELRRRATALIESVDFTNNVPTVAVDFKLLSALKDYLDS